MQTQLRKAPHAPFQTPNPIFLKTKACIYYEKGYCKRGKKCSFAHNKTELNPLPNLTRTKLCKNWGIFGSCHDGSCSFAHGVTNLRAVPEVPASPEKSSHQGHELETDNEANIFHEPETLNGDDSSSFGVDAFSEDEDDFSDHIQSILAASDTCCSTSDPLGMSNSEKSSSDNDSWHPGDAPIHEVLKTTPPLFSYEHVTGGEQMKQQSLGSWSQARKGTCEYDFLWSRQFESGKSSVKMHVPAYLKKFDCELAHGEGDLNLLYSGVIQIRFSL